MNFEAISIQPGFSEYVENMRYIRVYSEYTMDNYDEIDLLSTVYPILETSEYNLFKEALEFATSINYTHPGLSSKSYLKHPIRVTKLIANISTKPSIECLIIALLHNIFETSEISADLVIEKFGLIVTESIKRLTVDRSKSNNEYKQNYYKGIIETGRDACIVKSYDKFDNLFMLSTNPNKNTREAYLQEIETFVMPLVELFAPSLYGQFLSLCKYTYLSPYIDKQHYVKLVQSDKIMQL